MTRSFGVRWQNAVFTMLLFLLPEQVYAADLFCTPEMVQAMKTELSTSDITKVRSSQSKQNTALTGGGQGGGTVFGTLAPPLLFAQGEGSGRGRASSAKSGSSASMSTQSTYSFAGLPSEVLARFIAACAEKTANGLVVTATEVGRVITVTARYSQLTDGNNPKVPTVKFQSLSLVLNGTELSPCRPKSNPIGQPIQMNSPRIALCDRPKDNDEPLQLLLKAQAGDGTSLDAIAQVAGKEIEPLTWSPLIDKGKWRCSANDGLFNRGPWLTPPSAPQSVIKFRRNCVNAFGNELLVGPGDRVVGYWDSLLVRPPAIYPTPPKEKVGQCYLLGSEQPLPKECTQKVQAPAAN